MRRILTFATLLVALAATASAQTAGRITGTIKDPDGRPIKGATVRATNEAVNARITSTTDDKGRFAMIGVRSGRAAQGRQVRRGDCRVSVDSVEERAADRGEPDACNALPRQSGAGEGWDGEAGAAGACDRRIHRHAQERRHQCPRPRGAWRHTDG